MKNYLKEFKNEKFFGEVLLYHGLLKDQLLFKLRAIEQARNQFLVADYTLQKTNLILQEIEEIQSSNDKQVKSQLWNKSMKLRRAEKRDSAQKWLERLEILLDSLMSIIPGGEFLKEGKDFLKNLLKRGF